MNISNEFNLKSTGFVRVKTPKSQIVIGSTYNYGMNHFKANWRNAGEFKKTPHFTIERDGKIHQHFDIKYYSLYLDCNIDEHVISIALENIGQVLLHNEEFYDIYNNHYKGETFTQSWKNCSHWQPYTSHQLTSTINLCRYLLEETKILNSVTEINVYKQDVDSFQGICYRSNHNVKHYDVNPSWDFKQFKRSVETDWHQPS